MLNWIAVFGTLPFTHVKVNCAFIRQTLIMLLLLVLFVTLVTLYCRFITVITGVYYIDLVLLSTFQYFSTITFHSILSIDGNCEFAWHMTWCTNINDYYIPRQCICTLRECAGDAFNLLIYSKYMSFLLSLCQEDIVEYLKCMFKAIVSQSHQIAVVILKFVRAPSLLE
uniref:Uncharacterized protein n=1 Tax=Glossina austeni TaxID=7395 RepID=A0A1A9VYW7_GLOAU